MDPTLLLAAGAAIDEQIRGRELAGVLPSRRSGLHLVIRGLAVGLRIDTEPSGGAILLTRSRPERVRGGRGAWPDAAALADSRLSGQLVSHCSVASRGRSFAVVFEPGFSVRLDVSHGRALIGITVQGDRPRVLPPGVPEKFADIEPLDRAVAAARLESLAAGRPSTADLLAILPLLGVRSAEVLCREPPRIRRLAARLRGEDGPALVSGPSDFCPEAPPRAGWAGRLRLDTLPGDARTADRDGVVVFPRLLPAVELWHERASAAERLDRVRRAWAGTIEKEAGRTEKALAAVRSDDARAQDPEQLRREAEALLAAGPRAKRNEAGNFLVPDPYEPRAMLEIGAKLPGASAPMAAERLFAAARRQTRGAETRARRAGELQSRIARLAPLARAAREADTSGQLEAVEREAAELGLSLAVTPTAAGGPARTARRGPRERPARAFRSPSGLEVLVGRSAAQNDRLTFRLASPEDLWLHVRERSGAHVVIRSAGGGLKATERDVEFAAKLAAAYSSAPVGERVEVHVARRKHVRRLRGGSPGQVAVRRSKTIAVVAPKPPGVD